MKRNNKKALSFLLTLALVFGLFAGLTITASAATYTMTAVNGGASPASGDTVTIGSATEMGYFANYVNTAGTAASTSGITFKMTSDITITWTGARGNITVGSAATSSPTVSGTGFAGIFDGNNKTLTVNVTAVNSVTGGLIGYLEPTGLVKNLTMAGIVSASGSLDAIGGVVGYNSGVINGVKNNATVTGSSVYNIGGIAGFNDGYYAASAAGVIINSANTGDVTGASKAGGITGENAGYINSCSNTGDITNPGSGKNGAGGIAGRNGNNNTAVETGVIWNCYNKGDISVSNGRWGGGIVGFENAKSSVKNCYNIGSVTGYSNYNSIIGTSESTVTPLIDSYSLNTISGTGTAPRETGLSRTAAFMKTTAFATDLDNASGTAGGGIWAGAANAYPSLTYTASVPSTGGSPVHNGLPVVFLRSGGSDGNDGSTTMTAVKTLSKAVALADLSTNPAVYVSVEDTIPVSDAESVFGNGTKIVWNGSTGPMFDVEDDGVLIAGGLVIDGNGVSAVFNVEDGGYLAVRNNTSISDCVKGINVEGGGELLLNRSSISAGSYSVYLDDSTSTFAMFAASDQTITLDKPVYLASGAVITLRSALTSDITVECAEDPTLSDVLVAVSDDSDITDESLDYFNYAVAGVYFTTDSGEIYATVNP